MKRVRLFAAPFIVLAASIAAEAEAEEDSTHQWGQWRGPLATGFAPHADPPVQWSEEKNIRWKTALYGQGHSSPVVWGDRIFLTAAVPFGDPVEPVFDNAPGSHDNLPVSQKRRFIVLAVSRKSGRMLWRTEVHEAFPHHGGHKSGSLASNSPVTDGAHVFAFFGSHGLYCLDAATGRVIWKRDLGKMNTKHAHGEGASPALHRDTLIVNWDHEDESAIRAFDKKTGEIRWKQARDEGTSWSTPIIVEHGDQTQVIVSATRRIRAYDIADGALIWECGGLSNNVVASPVAGNGMVFCGSSYEKKSLVAILLEGARGDITGTDNVAWSTNQRTPYVPSPLLYGDTLYYLNHYQGILSSIEAGSGERRAGPFRLNQIGSLYASPVAAAGRVYFVDLEGTTLVISHGDNPQPLAVNLIDEPVSASPALVGKELFLRGGRHLYCIAEEEDAE